MKRRELTKNLAFAGATATTAIAINSPILLAQDGPIIQWRMATSWSEKNRDLVFSASKLICERVSQLTGGRFQITAFSAGGIALPLEILDVVQTGNVACGHTAGYYYTNKNPAFAFSSVLPFGLNAYQQMIWWEKAGGRELLEKLYSQYNVINFICCSAGYQMGGWFSQEVRTVADLKGLKMNISGLGGEIMQKLGVDVQDLPADTIVTALKQGKIDAAEWVGPYDDEKLGLNKAAPYYYYPGWHEPGTTYELIVNLDAWQKLPSPYQQALKAATLEVHLKSMSEYEAANRLALQRLIKGGTKLVPYSQEILTAAQEIAFALYEQKATESEIFKEIYDKWREFQQQIYEWDNISELSFANFSFATKSDI